MQVVDAMSPLFRNRAVVSVASSSSSYLLGETHPALFSVFCMNVDRNSCMKSKANLDRNQYQFKFRTNRLSVRLQIAFMGGSWEVVEAFGEPWETLGEALGATCDTSSS